MTHHWTSTEKAATDAQAKIIGRFCTRCRRHRPVEGGETLKAGSNRTRWVCEPCLRIIEEHKRWAAK
jgi:hypothetical protein